MRNTNWHIDTDTDIDVDIGDKGTRVLVVSSAEREKQSHERLIRNS